MKEQIKKTYFQHRILGGENLKKTLFSPRLYLSFDLVTLLHFWENWIQIASAL